MKEIKAIETKYNGYTFRSRLEARWAVFFDEIGVHYLYEHEGYDLTEANNDPQMFKEGKPRLAAGKTWYLPDFYLPDYNWCVEIKASAQTVGDGADKALLLSGQIRTALIFGSPGFGDYTVGCFVRQRVAAHGYFAEGRKCDRLWVVGFEGFSAAMNCDNCWSPKCNDKCETWAHRGLERAYEAARSARF